MGFIRIYKDIPEMLSKIDKFLSKQKEEYFAVIRYGKHLEFKNFLDKLDLDYYQNGDVLHIAILKEKLIIDVFNDGYLNRIRIWKEKEEDLYNEIQNRFLKLWKQYRRYEMINGGL